MIYLVDTNVILRLVDAGHIHHAPARAAVEELQKDHQLRATGQNFIEFWNVATRPADKNGLGWQPAKADQVLGTVEQLFPLLPDSPAIYPQWRQLVVEFGVSGVKAHDARLAAAMKVNDVTHILTFNKKDFIRYGKAGIVPVDPVGLYAESEE